MALKVNGVSFEVIGSILYKVARFTLNSIWSKGSKSQAGAIKAVKEASCLDLCDSARTKI
eukprot:scaffold135461_cov19-Tisochrysis_lutea.AAC.1